MLAPDHGTRAASRGCMQLWICGVRAAGSCARCGTRSVPRVCRVDAGVCEVRVFSPPFLLTPSVMVCTDAPSPCTALRSLTMFPAPAPLPDAHTTRPTLITDAAPTITAPLSALLASTHTLDARAACD